MIVEQLGRLQPVDLRTVWINEADNFTPWLAQDENLSLLGDTIGLELELEAVEKNVGPFRADIVCKDTVSDSYVLIENQLGRTDHNHLGQLLTYAAGLNTVTIVWIADRFTDEHRATLDWLNEVTNEDINLFGLEIELWRIADSPIAPKFNIISKPNDWLRTVSASRQRSSEELTPTKALQLEYWEGLYQYLEESNSFLRLRTPQAQHWMNFAVGRSGFKLVATVNMRDGRVAVQLVIHRGDIKQSFLALKSEREAVEAEIAATLHWRELPDKKQSDVTSENVNLDPNLRSQWPEQFAWFKATLESFHRAFSPRIKSLEVIDWEQEDEEP